MGGLIDWTDFGFENPARVRLAPHHHDGIHSKNGEKTNESTGHQNQKVESAFDKDTRPLPQCARSISLNCFLCGIIEPV